MRVLCRILPVAVLVSSFALGQAEPAESIELQLQRQLDRAAELNVTAPWQESQAILDEIEPLIGQGTPDQYATFQLLKIRNLALDGKLKEGLELTEQLLVRQIPPYQRLNALLRGANLAELARRYEDAFSYLRDALRLQENVNHPDLPTDVYSLAADMLAKVGELDKAMDYGHLSVRRAVQRGNVRAECVARQRLAIAYKAGDDLAAAIEREREALQSCQQANDPVLIGVVEHALADLLRQAGRFEEAESLFERALSRLRENGYSPGVAEARLGLARMNFQRGHHDLAEPALSELSDEFRNREAWDFLEDTHAMLAEIERRRGNHAKALEHLAERIEAREAHLDRDRALNLAYLEVEFDTQFKEQELALLREQAKVRELEAETREQQKRMRHLGYGIAAFLVLVLVLLLLHASRERRHFRSLARHDGLTGLHNHTRFFEVADLAFQISRRNNTPFTLVLADIDHFKQVNDQHGHLTGDDVLKRVSSRLREIFAGEAEIGRIGGEEFAIALPGWHSSGVSQPLEALRKALRHGRSDDKQIQVSVSFGVAERTDDQTLNELRERADQALYRAKRAGRDRVSFAE